MANGSRKQITFDLRQESLKQHYPHKEPVLNPQYYKKAYDDIQRFMARNGFEHRQYSVYVSKEKLTTLDVVGLMEGLAEQMPWLSHCVNEIDVTNIGVQHELKQTLEQATIDLDVDLGEASPESDLTIDLPEPEPAQTPPAQKSRKKRSSHER